MYGLAEEEVHQSSNGSRGSGIRREVVVVIRGNVDVFFELICVLYVT